MKKNMRCPARDALIDVDDKNSISNAILRRRGNSFERFGIFKETNPAFHVDRMGIIFGTYTRIFEAEEKAVVEANPQKTFGTLNQISKCNNAAVLIALHRKVGNTTALQEAQHNLELGRMLDFVN